MLSKLSNKYDKGIRYKCDDLRIAYEECLKINFNDSFVCDEELKKFNDCTKQYDTEFREKYNQYLPKNTHSLPCQNY